MTILLNIDVNKIDKNRLVERTFKGKEGEQTVKEMKLSVVPLKESRVVTSGPTWRLEKTHFVTQTPTKEEQANKTRLPIIGDGLQFVNVVDGYPTAESEGISGGIPF